ncbi:MAG TPA: sigma-70 family RNA polymerase sigma factor [Candidatus Avilachnospira avistercoris]|nr:sigma-70 family RNA polymerase sigma factor [Candidatus Avilachnospira avistercoris]
MQGEHVIIKEVYAAKVDVEKADDLIRRYMPFIKAEASRQTGRVCTEQDDEHSIAMIAFYEAIMGYEKERGSFMSYASMLIRSRIIDHKRKETKHEGQLSIYAEEGEEGRLIMDELSDERDHIDEHIGLEATKQEIEELTRVLARAGVTFSDVADNCPRQQRTFSACMRAIRCGADDGELLDEIERTCRLPLKRISELSGVERKTIERHRRYILAMLLIHTNGYEIVRGHLRHILTEKGGASV